MIYGYKRSEMDEPELLELQEVTFSVDSSTLRDLADFFHSMAEAMDSGEFLTCSHRHIETEINHWHSNNIEDIIVMPPSN